MVEEDKPRVRDEKPGAAARGGGERDKTAHAGVRQGGAEVVTKTTIVKPDLKYPPKGGKPGAGAQTMQARYDELVERMKGEFGLRVRKWRKSTSGCAWRVFYKDGTVANLLESPYPRGPMSAAVFLHEVGHHAIGFNTYKPRCLEELKAWAWSLRKMYEEDLNITIPVLRRVDLSLRYAVYKARKRKLKRLPRELVPFTRYYKPTSTEFLAVKALYLPAEEPPFNPESIPFNIVEGIDPGLMT